MALRRLHRGRSTEAIRRTGNPARLRDLLPDAMERREIAPFPATRPPRRLGLTAAAEQHEKPGASQRRRGRLGNGGVVVGNRHVSARCAGLRSACWLRARPRKLRSAANSQAAATRPNVIALIRHAPRRKVALGSRDQICTEQQQDHDPRRHQQEQQRGFDNADAGDRRPEEEGAQRLPPCVLQEPLHRGDRKKNPEDGGMRRLRSAPDGRAAHQIQSAPNAHEASDHGTPAGRRVEIERHRHELNDNPVEQACGDHQRKRIFVTGGQGGVSGK